MRISKSALLAILVSLLSLQSVSVAKEQSKNVVTLGVVPQQSAKVLAQKWIPLTRYLTEESGIQVKFATAKDIPTFEARLANKEYELAYMNPYHFVYFNKTSGYQALAKQREKQIRGIFVVRKDSPVTSLEDLNGARLAFPAPAAFAASILTRGTLEQQQIDFTPNYVSSHDSVYLNIAKGTFLAGGGVFRTFQLAPSETRQQLRILHTTQPYTPHALAVSEQMDPQTRSAILVSLLKLEKTEQGVKILSGINMKGFEAAGNNDWDDVKALNLSELMGFPVASGQLTAEQQR